MLSGLTSSGVLDPQGPVAHSERLILIDSTAIMLAVVIPVILATIAFAWWFRAGNAKATYRPDWAYSGRLETIVWAIPALVVLFLGGIGWVSSHDLDPGKPLTDAQPGDAQSADVRPLEVQVVSLDWKWLFIYPDQGIAGVNRLVVPAGRPVHFRLTSATVMNSFFVPQLGSQIYTMAGMATQLNLQADKPGTYPGISAQFSGDGFSDMRFDVQAVAQADFDKWVDETKSGGHALDYAALMQNSKAVQPAAYNGVEPGLFEKILDIKTEGVEGQQNAPNAPVSPRGGGS
ncbi:MAG TPA: ubiquinol oxidase subunit II [Alphaproteobacteria bacterium]|jgi:cytochrome o ubiquinol oxidase subunit 2|nr:ubiquinol oxidase subunit II [Alphaproteobacteria bacterium]